jgi:hypothetical protein
VVAKKENPKNLKNTKNLRKENPENLRKENTRNLGKIKI